MDYDDWNAVSHTVLSNPRFHSCGRFMALSSLVVAQLGLEWLIGLAILSEESVNIKSSPF